MLFPEQTSKKSLSPMFASIAKEEAAINLELKQYKQYYLNKVIQPSKTNNYIRVLKQLRILLVSYCKNVVQVDVQSIVGKMDELGVVMDDVIGKYEGLAVKGYDRVGWGREEELRSSVHEICHICAQPIQKAQIQRLKSHILNENNMLIRYSQDEEEKKDEQDINFFQEVNNMLTNKQGEIFQNQKKVNHFHNIAMNSLQIFSSIQKDLFEKKNQFVPNRNWVTEAKKQMEFLLKEYFQGKVPPFVAKMLNIFQQLQYRKKFANQVEVSVQTATNGEAEVRQLKRKNLQSSRKLQQFQSKTKIQQKELLSLNNEIQYFETKVSYLQKERKQLVDEIDQLKEENKQMSSKLNLYRMRSNNYPEDEGTQGEESVGYREQSFRETIRTNRSIVKGKKHDNEENNFPQIKVFNQKNKIQRNSRTSIRLNTNNDFASFSNHARKKSKVKLSHKTSLNSQNSSRDGKDQIRMSRNFDQSSNHSRQDSRELMEPIAGISKDKKKSFNNSDTNLFRSTIMEVEGESKLYIQNSKGVIPNEREELKQQLANMIKESLPQRTFFKKEQRSSQPLPQLKKIHHKKLNKEAIEKELKENRVKNVSEKENRQLNNLAGIYKELKERGCLIKISEEEFKFIVKVKAFNFDNSRNQSKENSERRTDITLQKFQDKSKIRHERLNSSRRDWNNKNYQTHRYRTVTPSFYSTQLFNKDYQVLFTNVQNAFNYENSLTKNHIRSVYTITRSEQILCKEIFDLVSQMKSTNIGQYNKICSFLRYPFQMMQNNTAQLQNSTLKYPTFEYYFEKISAIHAHCKKQNGVCSHLTEFRDKIAKGTLMNITVG